MDFYDFDSYYENLKGRDYDRHEEIEARVLQNRPRDTVRNAFDFDKSIVNELLNKEQLSDVDKHWIASMHNKAVEELVNCNKTTTSFDSFLQDRLGKEYYERLLGEWLQMQGNEFFQRVGLEKEMKPSAVYFMGNSDV